MHCPILDGLGDLFQEYFGRILVKDAHDFVLTCLPLAVTLLVVPKHSLDLLLSPECISSGVVLLLLLGIYSTYCEKHRGTSIKAAASVRDLKS